MEVHNETFAIIGAEAINLYSLENPILDEGDECYFLFFNLVDYHRPLLGKGTIITDRMIDGLHKKYFIELKEICESPKIIQEFILNKTFTLYAGSASETNRAENSFSKFRKIITAVNLGVFKSKTFYTEAFFVRQKQEEILKFRSEYISVVKKEIEKQLTDIEEI